MSTIDVAQLEEQKVVDLLEVGEIDEAGKSVHARSHSDTSSPKRVKQEDSSVHSDELSSSHPSEGDSASIASEDDGPEESEPSAEEAAEEVYEHAYQDEGLIKALHQGLIALKAGLTRKAETFSESYTFFKIDDEITDDFVGWVCENFIDWEKFEAREKLESQE